MKRLFWLFMLVRLHSADWARAEPTTPPVGGGIHISYGMCDASAGVAVGTNLFLAASDEDNILRLYRSDSGSNVVARFDLRSFVGKKETDLEGAARVANRVYWTGSHGIGPEGKTQFARRVFFATDLMLEKGRLSVRPVGRVYRRLVDDLLLDVRFERFDLRGASRRMAKELHALDIEALAEGPGGALLVGFRNPIVNGKALVIPLLNPDGVIGGEAGQFGDPLEFDVEGLGLRDMVKAGDAYYLIAGSYDAHHKFRFYRWAGPHSGTVVKSLPLPPLDDLKPEGLIWFPDRPKQLLVLSDDGNRLIGGVPGKEILNEAKQPFRWWWLKVDDSAVFSSQ